MCNEAPPSRRIDPVTPLVFLALLGAVLGLQWGSGAYRAELAGHPDEAAHYVTGLMLRDWVAAGLPASPLRFAENFYVHYPKVALGHWPPVFYLVQAAWTLVFSPSRVAVLLLMALLAAAVALLLYLRLRAECGKLIAVAMALLLVSLPIVQRFTHMVMTEVLVMLLSFGAALVYGRFLEKPAWRETILFSLLAVLAIMTNGKGLALALLPPLAVLIGWRWELLRSVLFWFPALPVAVLCGPWYALITSRSLAMAGRPSGEFTRVAAVENLRLLAGFFGWWTCGLILAGLAVKVLGPLRRGRMSGPWAALLALILSVWAFHSVVRAGLEWRYMMTAIPPAIALAGAGARWLADVLSRAGLRAAWAAVCVLLATGALYAWERFTLVVKPSDGYPALVRELLAKPEFRHSVMLVAADAAREGAFIAEVAVQERRPGHVVLRATKMLASSTWSGRQYRTRYDHPEDVGDFLESVPVGLVALDTDPTVPWRPHRQQLVEALRQRPDRWALVNLGAYPNSRLRVYRLAGHESRPAGKVRVDMRPRLGRVIESQ
jgi:4-amino-4-deoxy-L-arabinose transferase-like glycosyltransferase